MKKLLLAVAVLLLASGVSAGSVCYDEQTNRCYPNIFGSCSAGQVELAECPPGSILPEQPTPVPTAVPTPTPEPDWLERTGIKLSAARIAKILALLVSLAGTVQIIKKVLADIAKWEWLLKLVPPLAVVFKFLSQGIGPLILNAALTLTVLLPPLLSDGLFSIRDVLTVIGVFFGNIGAFVGIKRTIESWSGKPE